MEISAVRERKGYRGRLKRSYLWKELHNAVLEKLSDQTVILFLFWFYEFCIDHLETGNLPGYLNWVFTIRIHVLGGLWNALFDLAFGLSNTKRDSKILWDC